jgi:hypothetical protein
VISLLRMLGIVDVEVDLTVQHVNRWNQFNCWEGFCENYLGIPWLIKSIRREAVIWRSDIIFTFLPGVIWARGGGGELGLTAPINQALSYMQAPYLRSSAETKTMIFHKHPENMETRIGKHD